MPELADATEADRDAILAAAADYIESWLDGDAERMASCLHPKLVKRALDHRVARVFADEVRTFDAHVLL
jgi:Putative lumazine-binding